MKLRLLRGIARRGSAESGQALVLTMIVMAALTISIFATVSYMTSNETQFGRDRQSDRAFHITEAGLNDGLSLITNKDPNGTLTPSGPLTGSIAATLDTGTGNYSATKYDAGSDACTPPGGQSQNPCWVVTATATSPDGKISRELQETVYWNSQTVDESQVFDFGLFVDNGTGPCVWTHGGAGLDLSITNVWISGCLRSSGSAVIHPPADDTGFIYVGGDVDGGIAKQTDRYHEADILGTCSGGICSDSAHSGVWATTFSGEASQLQKPDINAANVYLYGNPNGKPGDPTVDWSHPTCTGGSYTFDTDTTMNQSVSGATLLPSGTFDCTVEDSDGNVIGTLSRSGSVVNITGTIFIDGDINVTNGGSYTGNGTIYVNGTADGAGNISICGPADTSTGPLVSGGCSHSWDPTLGKMGLVIINPTGADTAFTRHGNGEIDVDLFVSKGYTNTGGTIVTGSIIADAAEMGGGGGLVTAGGPPDGAPITKTVSTGWTVSPGSWKQNH